MIYLDNNATTQVDEEVIAAMQPYFKLCFANPSSLHHMGKEAHSKISEVRHQIANSIGCCSDEIIFTSSGSEANNLCLKGFAFANRHKGNHIITSKIEHVSILNSCAFLETQGFEVTYLEADAEGFIHPDTLKKAIKKDTILISIAHVNNEIGTLQNLQELLHVAKGIPFHTDAIQSFLKTDFRVDQLPIDLASFSGHKFHAPKGIGFIFKRKSIQLAPQVHGGQQENDLRAGTENVPYIIGLGRAIKSWDPIYVSNMKKLQAYLLVEIKKIPGLRLNGPENLESRVCTNMNISFDGFEGETLLYELANRNISVSTGSACHSKSSRISHVLEAIKCPARYIHGNIRLGLSKYTTIEDIDLFISKIQEIYSDSEATIRLY